MKKNVFIWMTVAAVLAGLLAACGREKGLPGFGPAAELRADSIAIGQILQPRTWVATGGKAIVGSVKGSDSLLYAYSLPDFKFLYKGVRTGGGPGELANPYADLIQQYDPDGRFTLYHFGNGLVYYFSAADTGFVAESAKVLPRDGTREVYSGGELMVDSDLPWTADYQSENRQKVYLYLYDMNTGNTLDSVLSQSVYAAAPGRDWGNFKNGTISLYNDSLCAVAYDKTGRVEFYDISGGTLKFKGFAGDDTPLEKLMSVDFDAWNGKDYTEAATDDRYLYLLVNPFYPETDDPAGKAAASSKVPSEVLVYDWEGHPVKHLRLDKSVDNILAGAGRIYAYDSDRDFEQVYVYDPGL